MGLGFRVEALYGCYDMGVSENRGYLILGSF